jgi:hypothetical protein
LAGGIGEQYFGEKRQIVENPEAGLNDLKEQSGCHFDFKKAKIIAKNLVVSFKTNSKNSNQILLECYTKAVTLVKTNEDMIMLLAQKLAEKDILYVDEIYSSLNLTRHKFELE